MKYILYFGGYDNNTYFYETIEQMLEHWGCKTLEQFIKKHKKSRYGMAIFKIEKVIFDSEEIK